MLASRSMLRPPVLWILGHHTAEWALAVYSAVSCGAWAFGKAPKAAHRRLWRQDQLAKAGVWWPGIAAVLDFAQPLRPDPACMRRPQGSASWPLSHLRSAVLSTSCEPPQDAALASLPAHWWMPG